MLAGIRMDAVRGTPLYQKFVANRSLPALDDFARESGFDPRRDVRELLIASNGKSAIIAARGAFSEQSVKGSAKQSYAGARIYTLDPGAVALIDETTAVAGALPDVKAALDRRQTGGHAGSDGLLARARRIPRENQVWSVATNFDNLLISRIPQAENAAGLLQSLESTTLALDLSDGIHGYLSGNCSSDEEAKSLGDSARGLIALARLGVPGKQRELLRLWDGIKVDQQQRTVKITVEVPEDLAEKLLDWLGPRVRN